jgi:hypothetical protein
MGIGAAPAPEGLSDLLRACHSRIRRVCTGLRALATEAGRSDPRAADTARACARYLDTALLLHARDEEESVGPRLRHLALPEDIVSALDHSAAGHAEIVAALGPARVALHGPWGAGHLPASSSALLALAELLEAHLAEEEATWLPFVDRIDAAGQAAAVAELRGRRR